MITPSRIAIAIAVLLLALTAPALLSFYTDWLWFGEVGYQSVFLTMIRAQGLLLVASFAIALAWLAANIRVAVSGIGDLRPVFTTREGLEVALPGGRQLRSLGLGIASLLAVIVALYAAGNWETWLLWRNAVTFGEADPILGRDVSFYVFSLPFLQGIRGIAQALVILAALAASALYLVSGSLTSGFPARLSMSRHARRHLSLLAALFFLLLAWGAWLHRTEHLVETSGLVYGASYADVHGRMPAAFLVMAACVIGAALSVAQAYGDRNWPIPAAIGLYLVAAVGSEVYSSALQRFVVTPNEQVRETPFIQHNIRATRRAFALDGVEEREVSGDARLTRDDIARNSATLDNVQRRRPRVE